MHHKDPYNLGAAYKPNSVNFIFELMKNEQKAPKINPYFAAVIQNLKRNEYLSSHTNEAITRTILDLILVDRLNQLKDINSFCRVLLSAEVYDVFR